MAAGVELLVPFLAVAAVFFVTGLSDQSTVFLVIKKSPVMTVVLFTASLFYLPAVFTLAGASAARIRDIVNPVYVLSVIRLMEREYVASIFFVIALLGVTWAIGTAAGAVPLLPRLVYAVATVYILVASGYVFGKLYTRFSERLDPSRKTDKLGSE